VNEATLKRDLVAAIRAAMPGAVIFRHEDRFTAGVPDLSVTWRGTTSWVEVKYSRRGRRSRPTALQARALRRLAAAGAPAYLLEYREEGGGRITTLDVVDDLGVTSSPVEARTMGAQFDHGCVARALALEHSVRARRRGEE
jgi:hypothetical protein